MDSDQERQAVSFVSGLILGAVIGAGVAFLTVPQPGRKTRRRLRRVAGRLQGSATDRIDEWAGEFKTKVDEAVRVARSNIAS
ncbi:MAG: YtxH domain-containing protein [Gemmatimonadetes bacterium]|nr:YtxH domain-containing protein [Gemmatimonadota bacterium]